MQERRWPDPDATAPFIMSGNFTHSILHPIANPLAALLVGPQVPLHLDLLRCRHEQLNLLVQNFRRTDRSPPPGSPGAATAQAFHQDSAFLGRHYHSTPVQSYYITMLALSPVRHGVAPFLVVDDSLRVARCAQQDLCPPKLGRGSVVPPWAQGSGGGPVGGGAARDRWLGLSDGPPRAAAR